MRISELTTTVVAVPFQEAHEWAGGRVSALTNVIVELATDEGLVGLGEACGYPSPQMVEAVAESFKSIVLGEDPFAVERVVRKLYTLQSWHILRATSSAIAAVEMACWDLVGKACDQPLVNLFGGRVRDRVEFFAFLPRRAPQEVAIEARRAVDRGFRTLYLKVGDTNPRNDVERVEAVRDAAGPEVKIRVDANEAWSPGGAIRITRELERFDLEFVEQPVSTRNLAEMAYVRSRITPPLLADQLWTRYDQLDVIRHGAADAISLDNQWDGGLLNMKVAAGICDAAGLPVLKHSSGELGIALYAAAHVVAATPNFLFANQTYDFLLADDVLVGTDRLPYENGQLVVPDRPGIGVELDEEKVARYAEAYRRNPTYFESADALAAIPTPLVPHL